MKKTLAIIAALVMALTATAALAEEPAKPTFSGGVARTVMDKYTNNNYIVVSLLLGGLLLGHSDN